MKKSYHSNTVPAEEAAITSRISLALGSPCAAVSAMILP
jgi:hypothetical protein